MRSGGLAVQVSAARDWVALRSQGLPSAALLRGPSLLHANGDITSIFGRSIPVLVHELEYYDEIAAQNLAANPPGLVDDFATFCRGEDQ